MASSQPDPDVLAGIATELVDRIRTEEPTGLCRELLGPLDGWEMWGLVCLLAAAVDPSVHPDIWWGWVRHIAALRVVRDPDEVDDQDPEVEILDRIRHLATVVKLTDAEIGDRVGMGELAVSRRRQRAGIPPARPRAPGKWQKATEGQVAA